MPLNKQRIDLVFRLLREIRERFPNMLKEEGVKLVDVLFAFAAAHPTDFVWLVNVFDVGAIGTHANRIALQGISAVRNLRGQSIETRLARSFLSFLLGAKPAGGVFRGSVDEFALSWVRDSVFKEGTKEWKREAEQGELAKRRLMNRSPLMWSKTSRFKCSLSTSLIFSFVLTCYNPDG